MIRCVISVILQRAEAAVSVLLWLQSASIPWTANVKLVTFHFLSVLFSMSAQHRYIS